MTFLTCPHCRRKFALEQARDDADWRAYLEVRATLPPAIHRALDEYLELFRPAKTELRPSRMRRLTEELAPMIREGEITRVGHTYLVPLSRFIAAMQYLVDTPPTTMLLPLKTHGYLLSVLAKQAEQAEARAEQQVEHQRRQQPRTRTAGRPVPVAETLAKASTPIDREAALDQIAKLKSGMGR